jgi:hypothetical protein
MKPKSGATEFGKMEFFGKIDREGEKRVQSVVDILQVFT